MNYEWWVVTESAEYGEEQLAGPFTSGYDAAKARNRLEDDPELLEVNMWVRRYEVKV